MTNQELSPLLQNATTLTPKNLCCRLRAITLPATNRARKIEDVLRKNVVFSVAYQNAARNFTRP
jgi:hypothetical protein